MPPARLLDFAVILAGGLGTRLGHLTRSTPKPLVAVNGKPFLEHQLNLLARNQVSTVLILTGFQGHQIESALGTGNGLGLKLLYSQEPEPLGTGGALRFARALLPPEFFLLNGDTYVDIDYQSAYCRFLDFLVPGPAGLMSVYPAGGTQGDEPGNVKLDSTGTRILSYQKGAGGDHSFVDVGALILTSPVTDWIPSRAPAGLEETVLPRLAEEGRLVAFNCPIKFYDIGTPDRLAAFERSLT